jgi:hypothetical protein
MLDYVKHDEEFHCSIKLMNGEEIIARAIVTKDVSEEKDIVYLEDPLVVQSFTKEVAGDKAIKGMGFSKWQNFSDEDFYIINAESILTMASLSKEMVFVYESFLAQSRGGTPRVSRKHDKHRVNLTENEGSLGKIDAARKKLEDLFGKS